jgi:hypothetical protein
LGGEKGVGKYIIRSERFNRDSFKRWREKYFKGRFGE